MENQYILHSGVKGMKWGVRKQHPDRKKARSEYNKRLKETSKDRSFAREAGGVAGGVIGFSITGPAAKLITGSVLKRIGNKNYSGLSTAAGLGTVALTSLGTAGFMEAEFRRQLKRGKNPIEQIRLENERASREYLESRG